MRLPTPTVSPQGMRRSRTGCDPKSSPAEANLGSAYAASGSNGLAELHLERALEIDPMNLSTAEQLIGLYEKDGETAKAEMLKDKISRLLAESLGK